ncbi:hypothetical protein NDU88_002700 [Pleurodeles waltl]|uniref:Uncharacterized protein n=1 Tax=Pleurodeles waltl TaxID=8319 RepID=A0AAV7U9Z8_PLEWA|nr:hypothetical protein NDU88_002700 [Pleurodeles waltl]
MTAGPPARGPRFVWEKTEKATDLKRGMNRRGVFPGAFTHRIALPVDEKLETAAEEPRVTDLLDLVFGHIINQLRRRTGELTIISLPLYMHYTQRDPKPNPGHPALPRPKKQSVAGKKGHRGPPRARKQTEAPNVARADARGMTLMCLMQD